MPAGPSAGERFRIAKEIEGHDGLSLTENYNRAGYVLVLHSTFDACREDDAKKLYAVDHRLVQFSPGIEQLAATNPIHSKKLRATFGYIWRLMCGLLHRFA